MSVNDEAVLFVFYSITSDNILSDVRVSWKQRLAKGWRWTGSGSSGKQDIPYEVQYNGPMKSREKMIELLTIQYDKLKQKGVINKYKIYKKFPKLNF